MSEISPIPVEDVDSREPEWEPIERGYGQPPTMRTYEYDPVHDEIRVDGPIVVSKPPEAPAP